MEFDPEIWLWIFGVPASFIITLKRFGLIKRRWTKNGDADMNGMRPECKDRVKTNAVKIDQLENDRTKNMTNIDNLTKGMDKIEKKIEDRTKEIFDKLDSMKDTQRKVEGYLEALVKRG